MVWNGKGHPQSKVSFRAACGGFNLDPCGRPAWKCTLTGQKPLWHVNMSVNKEQLQQSPPWSSTGRWQERCSFWHTPVSTPRQRETPFLPRLRLDLTGQVSRANTAQALSFFSSILSLHSSEPRRRAGSRAVPAGRAVPGALPSATMAGGRPAVGSRSPASAWLRAAWWRGRRGGGETRPPGSPSPGLARLSRRRGVGSAPEGLSSEPPAGPVPAGRGLSAGRRRLPLGSAPRSAPEPLQREDGDGGRERRAGLRHAGGLGSYGSGNRAGGSDLTGARRAAVGMGRSRTVPGDLPPPLRPSALLLPWGGTGLGCGGELCPAPGEKRGERGGPLFPRPPSSGAAPLFLPAARPAEELGAGRAQAGRCGGAAPVPFPERRWWQRPEPAARGWGNAHLNPRPQELAVSFPPFLSRSSLRGWGTPGQRPFSSRPRDVRGPGRRGSAERPSGSLLPSSRLREALREAGTARGYGRMQADSRCPPLLSFLRLVACSVAGEQSFSPQLSPTRSARGPGGQRGAGRSDGAGGRAGAAVREPGRSESSAGPRAAPERLSA